jgi:hypothetical protein
MKLKHIYLTICAGLFSYTLYAQVSTNEAPAAAPADNTVMPEAALVALEQPASSNEMVTANVEAPVTGEAASTSLTPEVSAFDKSPYPVILEKMPFGTPPDLTALNAAATSMDAAKMKVEQDKLAATFSWTAINITPDGKTAIGFTDLSAKPPANYYMTVGESANDWTVVEADYASETATIQKGEVSISLKFGNKSPITPTPPGGTPTSPAPLGAPALTMPGHNHGRLPSTAQPTVETTVITLPSDGGKPTTVTTTTTGHSALLTSYRDRLNERLKAQENQKQETSRKQQEEISKLVNVSISDALRKQQEEAAAAAAAQQLQVEGQPVEGQQIQHIEIQVQ